MTKFAYEKPSVVEVTQEEVNAIETVLYSTPPAKTYDDYVAEATGFFMDGQTGISMLAACIDKTFRSESALYRAWMLFRVLGGFCYNDQSLGEMGWNIIAGHTLYAEDATSTHGVPLVEEAFCTSTLHLPEIAYRALRYNVRLQHELCGKDASHAKYNESYWGIWYECVGYQGDFSFPWDFTKKITKDTFEDYYNMHAKSICGKVDFAHLCITVATALATDLHLAGGGLVDTLITARYSLLGSSKGFAWTREALAGWLGDACLIDPGESKTSFSRDDYFADLDALHIGDLVRKSGFTAQQALLSVYAGVPERRTYFLSRMSLADAKEAMRLAIFPDVATANVAEWEKMIHRAQAYEDTARFLDILSGTAAEPRLAF